MSDLRSAIRSLGSGLLGAGAPGGPGTGPADATRDVAAAAVRAPAPEPRLRAPADDAPHTRTWMSWPSRRSVWGRQLGGVQQDIALIARTIARFEPVLMCAADDSAAAAARARCGSGVTVTSSIPNDDLWTRDTGPLFRNDGRGGLDAVGLNFNGWGRKQTHDRDALVARGIAAHEALPFGTAAFVGEPGAVETDGDGTLLATESSLVNRNRNRGMSRDQVERAVLDAYGAERMIWVPGVKGRDITDDHVDVTSRFVRPGVVLVQVPPSDRNDVWARGAREQFALLAGATDARGRQLQVIPVFGPDRLRSSRSSFVDSYLNFHLVNGGVITAQFGDPAKDAAAGQTLAAAFPGREVVQLDVDRLMAGGGGIHCSTMQQPLA